MNASSSSSMHSIRDTSLSRRPSIEDVPEYDEAPPALTPARTPPTVTPPTHTPPTHTPSAASSAGTSADDGRGRRHTRFSFAGASSLLDDLKDRVRSSSPKTREARNATISRERRAARSRDVSPRGRAAEAAAKEKEKEDHHRKSAFAKLLKGDDKDGADGWKEFKKGACSLRNQVRVRLS